MPPEVINKLTLKRASNNGRGNQTLVALPDLSLSHTDLTLQFHVDIFKLPFQLIKSFFFNFERGSEIVSVSKFQLGYTLLVAEGSIF